jgi:hypothetical protein
MGRDSIEPSSIFHRMQFQSARDGHDVLMPVKRHDVAFFTGPAWGATLSNPAPYSRMQFQSARDGHDVLMPVKRHDVAFFHRPRMGRDKKLR